MYKNNMKDINKIIIIGAGHSGTQAAAGLREKLFSGKITIIEKESQLPYQKPPLSKKFLLDTKDSTSLLRSFDWYKNNNINLLNNINIIKIDKNEKIIIDQKNNKYSYDKLILATGSINKTFNSFNFENLTNVINLRTLDDSINLRNLLLTSDEIVIIGAGFIGLEVASVARTLNKKVTIIEASNRVMPRNVSNNLSQWYINFHKKMGINFLFNEKISSIEQIDNKAVSVKTLNNYNLKTDCLLTAIGSIPETSLAEKLGLIVKNGICVNEYMQTDDPDIYAIGDCSNFFLETIPIRLESIQNAVDQSKIAVSNILKEEKKYIPLPWFWSDQYNLKLQIVGLINDNLKDRKIKMIGSIDECQFSNLVFDQDKLVSIESVNRPAHHMLFKNYYKYWDLIKPEMIKKDLDLKLFFQQLAK